MPECVGLLKWEEVGERFLNVCVLFCGVTHVSPACCVLDFVQGATFSLNVAKVQFNTRNHDLGTTG